MTIEGYFWLTLIVLLLLMAGIFGIGFAVGGKTQGKGGGVGVGIAILVVLAVFVGGAKALEARVGPLLVYEASWLTSALNFALAGGYLAGKNRNASASTKLAVPLFCLLVSLLSLGILAAKLHQLVEIMNQLGIGKKTETPAGPDTSLNCKQSLNKIYLGFQHYAEVNDALPPAAKWMEEEDLRGAVQADEWMHDPAVSDRKDNKFGYAYNEALAGRKLNGKKLNEMPDAAKTPLVYDSTTLAKNAHDALSTLPRPGRHNGKNDILYCDGHIESVAPK